MPPGWGPVGDHDPAWLRDGTLAVDDVEIPPDGGAAGRLDLPRFNEWRDGYLATIGQRVDSPDGSHTADVGRGGRSLRVDGSTLLTVERGTSLGVIGFSPEGDRVLFSSHGEGGVTQKLWIVGVDGSDPRVIVAGTVDGDWFVPAR